MCRRERTGCRRVADPERAGKSNREWPLATDSGAEGPSRPRQMEPGGRAIRLVWCLSAGECGGVRAGAAGSTRAPTPRSPASRRPSQREKGRKARKADTGGKRTPANKDGEQLSNDRGSLAIRIVLPAPRGFDRDDSAAEAARSSRDQDAWLEILRHGMVVWRQCVGSPKPPLPPFRRAPRCMPRPPS